MTQKSDAPVLVVDDDDDTRDLVRTALEMEGYAVLEAENGKVALDLLTAGSASEPCLIVLDLEMPVMPGWEFLAIIKGYHRPSQIPVIVVTGCLPRLEHLDAIAHSALVAKFQKPVDLEELVLKVKEFARKHCG
jgi:CheY-like chemotaxis protein